jgi:hypothetical protein
MDETMQENFTAQHSGPAFCNLTDEAMDDDRNELSHPQDAEPFTLWAASAWLYQAAIHDSKKDIDIEIRRRRTKNRKR